MLSGVSPMQTEARCARNHRKPGISAACVPASSPYALKFGREEVMVPSLCVQDRDTAHHGSENQPSGRDVKAAEQSECPGAGDGGATLFEPSDFAALSPPGNVGVAGSTPPAKNGPDAFFSPRRLPPCLSASRNTIRFIWRRQKTHNPKDGILHLKTSPRMSLWLPLPLRDPIWN
ncbi:uncharacterized protein LOC112209777 isoform X2 [Pan troglodytes]|uniref:uncharacterized protein LOC112209777 isoform X2 n=1 Tax=Pan troglodytes TaxID=9598 RepID=UPI000D09B489|nr:uncharacterized protein LOC112209777 isoform X2 [Pan troglodytes]